MQGAAAAAQRRVLQALARSEPRHAGRPDVPFLAGSACLLGVCQLLTLASAAAVPCPTLCGLPRVCPAADEQKEEWCAADPRKTFKLNKLTHRVSSLGACGLGVQQGCCLIAAYRCLLRGWVSSELQTTSAVAQWGWSARSH